VVTTHKPDQDHLGLSALRIYLSIISLDVTVPVAFLIVLPPASSGVESILCHTPATPTANHATLLRGIRYVWPHACDTNEALNSSSQQFEHHTKLERSSNALPMIIISLGWNQNHTAKWTQKRNQWEGTRHGTPVLTNIISQRRCFQRRDAHQQEPVAIEPQRQLTLNKAKPNKGGIISFFQVPTKTTRGPRRNEPPYQVALIPFLPAISQSPPAMQRNCDHDECLRQQKTKDAGPSTRQSSPNTKAHLFNK